MKQIYLITLLLLAGMSQLSAQHQADLWQPITLDQLDLPEDVFTNEFATEYELLELDVATFRPGMIANNEATRTIQLPLPNGETIAVQAQWDPVIAPGLSERYPEISTYRVVPNRTVKGGRLGWTYQGLHATIHTDEGTIYIDPYATTDNRYYISYYVHENIDEELWASFTCDVTGDQALDPHSHFPGSEQLSMLDAQLTGPPVVQRTYRLAMAAAPSYTNYHGGTVSGALSAQVVVVNRLNEIFATDLAVRLELIADNDKVIFTNGVTNPYPSNVPGEIHEINHEVLRDSIGLANFDVGHVVTRHAANGEGIGLIGSVCRDEAIYDNQGMVISFGGAKGMGASARNPPVGDPFTVRIVAHEFGHQLNGLHTMSFCHNVQPQTAYEPGSGVTIMSYNGICGSFNIPTNGEAYYHGNSVERMRFFIHEGFGTGCGETMDFGNTAPDVSLPYENGFYIPISTPFELTANAVDSEGDELSYCWEGFDIWEDGNFDSDPEFFQHPQTNNPTGTAPLFRTFSPVPSPTRVFPRMGRVVANNYDDVYEILPTYSRDLTFRCTVRDNHPDAGAAAWAEVSFNATANAGPFEVMSPNVGVESWLVGDYVPVTWDVANTDQSPVNCQLVNIRLSTDGGFTYPITLVENVPNTGTAFVTVPDAVTTIARVRVEAADNIFFDISNTSFDIEPATEPSYTINYTPAIQSICSQEELASVEFVTTSILGFDTVVALDVFTALPDGVIANLSADTIHPGDFFSLDLDFSNSSFDGVLDVDVRAIAPSLDTFFRTFTVEVINSNFSALELISPFEGEDEINLSTGFTWTDLPNSDFYEWELATSPVFGETLIASEMALDTAAFTPFIILEENTLFFWRVRAKNECVTSDWTPTRVFHTLNAICQDEPAEDTPITIPGTGPLPTRESEINVPFDGIISDINIPIVNVQYQPIQNFRISLISPSETEVVLYDGNCFGTDRVNIGFDDDAPNEILCPPDDNIVFRPVEPLSAFIGESSQGVWTMKVQVLETGFGVAGAIDGWAIEFCATGSAEAPLLITNEALEVPPGQENPISQELLEVQSSTAGDAQLEYTIVSAPEHGTIKFLGEEAEIGETFSQASINAFNVSYEHDGSMTTDDSFTFVVRDGMGGFIPVQTFMIAINENAVVNTEELLDEKAFQLFPNPTSDWVRLVLPQTASSSAPVRIYNVQGQLVRELNLAAGSKELYFDVSELTAGIYLVQYGSRTLRLAKH